MKFSLLNDLGDSLEPKHILYSSIDELKKIKQEKERNSFRKTPTGLGTSIDSSAPDITQAPLPKDSRETKSLPDNDKDNKINDSEINLKHEVKLLDKIPIEKEKIHNLNYETDEQNNEMTLLRGYLSFDEDNEIDVSHKQKSTRQSKIQDEQFNKMIKHIYQSEGGFVDNKNDRGGRTNKGITQKTFDAYNAKTRRELKDVKDITFDESDEIYYNEYYKASGADKIKDKNLQYLHPDTAINHGVGRAKQFLEQSEGNYDKYMQIRRGFYGKLSKKPKQKTFYRGWINRLDNIDRIKRDKILED